ncbi:transposable element Tcb1 transposase [Trichonephila clavipes]|nr:transposable element Tcb1 transposase [Trichonephila clavipes]
MSTMSQRSHLTNSESWRVVGSGTVFGDWKCRPKRPGQGRRWATTPNEDRYLVLTARRHRNMNATVLQQHLRSATGTTVLTQTVRNRLHGVGLNARRSMSRYSVHPDDSRIFIWRDRGSRNNPAFVHENVRFGGGGVLVYGGISIDGRTDLYIIRDGPLNARRYRDEILRPIIIPYAAAIGDDFILIDDNCRPHRANLVEDFLFEEGIQRGLSARRPLLGILLTQNHKRLLRQWYYERRLWAAEWNEVLFTDESRICLQHHDGRIRVWRHRGDRMLNSCFMHCHTGPATGIMIWGGIGYHSPTLVRIAGILNSQRYISEVLDPVVLPYLQGLATAIFQQDNARPLVTRIVPRFFVNNQIKLLPWPARSLDPSPIENIWSMVAQRLTQITLPAATPEQLWQRVEAAWSAVP